MVFPLITLEQSWKVLCAILIDLYSVQPYQWLCTTLRQKYCFQYFSQKSGFRSLCVVTLIGHLGGLPYDIQCSRRSVQVYRAVIVIWSYIDLDIHRIWCFWGVWTDVRSIDGFDSDIVPRIVIVLCDSAVMSFIVNM